MDAPVHGSEVAREGRRPRVERGLIARAHRRRVVLDRSAELLPAGRVTLSGATRTLLGETRLALFAEHLLAHELLERCETDAQVRAMTPVRLACARGATVTVAARASAPFTPRVAPRVV